MGKLLLVSALLVQTLLVRSEETTTPALAPLNDEIVDYSMLESEEASPPEIVLDSLAGFPQISTNKHLALTFLDRLSPSFWLRPLTDKITKIADFVSLVHHPNFGGVQLLSPQHLWEKLHMKGHHYWTGPYGSIYGAANVKPVDYPFAYRKSKST